MNVNEYPETYAFVDDVKFKTVLKNYLSAKVVNQIIDDLLAEHAFETCKRTEFEHQFSVGDVVDFDNSSWLVVSIDGISNSNNSIWLYLIKAGGMVKTPSKNVKYAGRRLPAIVDILSQIDGHSEIIADTLNDLNKH